MKKEKAKEISYRDVFFQKEYVKIIFSNMINRFGDSIDAIAFTWLVYSVTGSASWSAVIFALNQLPTVFLQPFAGALVEGMNKKRVMVAADAVRGVITAGLALLYVTGQINPWVLAGFTLLNSSVEAFGLPAGMALVPKLLEKKYYSYGSSLNNTVSTVVQLIGLSAAGVIIAALGIWSAILIDAASFFGSALIRARLRVKEEDLHRESLKLGEYKRSLAGGVRYLKEKPVIRNFCILGVVINAVMVPLNSLQSPLTDEVFGQGSGLLSVLSIACMVGMGFGSAVFPAADKRCSVRSVIVTGGILAGAGTYAYSLGTFVRGNVMAGCLLAAAASILVGFGIGLISTALNVQFVKVVEQDYLARAGSVFNAAACAATPAASAAVGALAAICPVRQIFVVSGMLCVVLFVYTALRRVQFE